MNTVTVTPLVLPRHRDAAGLVETALYAATLVMATGPFDQLIQQNLVTEQERATGWGMIYAGFAMLLMIRPRLLVQALGASWPLFAMPALALLSVIWSEAPLQTLTGGLEMATAVLFGALMGCRINERRLLTLLVLGLTALTLVDVAVVQGPLGHDINDDAVGLFSHKNIHGQVMSVLVLSCLTVLVWGGPRLPALLGLAMGAPLLGLTGSRGAWIMTGSAIGALLLLSLGRLSPRMRFVAAFFGIALGCGLALLWSSTQLDLANVMLDSVGKDQTLTGRTTLWDLAAGYIDRAPLLGHGFNGFWSEDITSDSAFVNSVLDQELQSFHNGYLEMAVELGWLGAGLEIAVMTAFLWPIGRLLAHGDKAAAAFAAALLTVCVVGNLSEVMLFLRHGFHLILMAALWSRSSFVHTGKSPT